MSMKVLTVCSAGTVRSVAMAHVLKFRYGIDALAAGHDGNSQKTLDMLSDWADRIIVMQPKYAAGFPMRNAKKIIVADVGPDVWQNPLHPGLLKKVMRIAKTLDEKGVLRST